MSTYAGTPGAVAAIVTGPSLSRRGDRSVEGEGRGAGGLEAEQRQPGGHHGGLDLEVVGQLLDAEPSVDALAQLLVLLGRPRPALGDGGPRRTGLRRSRRHRAGRLAHRDA